MIPGQGLTFLAVSLQSAGKVLYGTFLAGVSTATFLLFTRIEPVLVADDSLDGRQDQQ